MAAVPTISLYTGAKMPIIGLGTFLANKPGEAGAAVRTALEAGYRAIDCARVYMNEEEIGNALQAAYTDLNLKREDLFITSKLWSVHMKPQDVRAGLEESLQKLKLTYLDLYLVHIPVATEGIFPNCTPRHEGFGLQDTWRALEACVDAGLIKALGVSNFNAQTLNDCLAYSRIKPAVNQVERHPFLQQQKLVDFARRYGVITTAYSSLGSPGLPAARGLAMPAPGTSLLENDVVSRIAQKHNKSNAQVLIRWSIDTDVVTIPKSVTPSRIQENFNVLDFVLDSDDLEALRALECGGRYFNQEWSGVPAFF